MHLPPFLRLPPVAPSSEMGWDCLGRLRLSSRLSWAMASSTHGFSEGVVACHLA